MYDTTGSDAGYATPHTLTPLAALQFLLGQWKAISQAGEAEGGFSVEPQLLGRIIVRTNYAAYPANGEREAFRHEDLM